MSERENTFYSKIEKAKDTNTEELIVAAHAGVFQWHLSIRLLINKTTRDMFRS
jgi:hypothetical protein